MTFNCDARQWQRKKQIPRDDSQKGKGKGECDGEMVGAGNTGVGRDSFPWIKGVPQGLKPAGRWV